MQEKKIDLLDTLLFLLENKRKLFIHFICISILSVIFSLLLPKTYKASATFLPPNIGSGSGLAALMPNFAVDILGANEIKKSQIVTIINSREIKEKIIYKFDLIKIYKVHKAKNYLEKALKIFDGNLNVTVEEEGGLGFADIISISIDIFDKDSNRCANMTNFYLECIDERIRNLNASRAHNNRLFIEKELVKANKKLVGARNALTEFQLVNKIYNIPEQIKIVIQSTANLKSEILALETKRNYLLTQYKKTHPSVKDIETQIGTLNNKILEVEKNTNPDLFVGLEISLDLSYKYADMFLEVETISSLIRLLRQQFEQAKIQEAKDVESIRIIDRARVPQWKIKPKRAYIVLGIVLLYMILLIAYLILHNSYQHTKYSNPELLVKVNKLLQHIPFVKKIE